MTAPREPEYLVDSQAESDRQIAELLRQVRRDGPSQAEIAAMSDAVLRRTPGTVSWWSRGRVIAGVSVIALGFVAGRAWTTAPAASTPAPASARIEHVPALPTVTSLAERAESAGHAASAAPAHAPRERAVSPVTAAQREQTSVSPPTSVAEAQAVPARPPALRPTVEALPVASALEVAARAPDGESPPAPFVQGGPVTRATRSLSGAGQTTVYRQRQAADRTESELTLLAHAQETLTRAPAQALAVLHKHAARYPNGRYAQERAALECDALAKLGRKEELQRAAAEFLRANPDSPHARRIGRYL